MTRVFPGAGPGQDQQRAVHIFNGRALLRIHVFKQSGHEREYSCGRIVRHFSVSRGIDPCGYPEIQMSKLKNNLCLLWVLFGLAHDLS